VQVRIYHPWFIKGKKLKPVTLTTDKDGRIKLGQLKKVMKVTCNASSLKVSQSWYIGKQFG